MFTSGSVKKVTHDFAAVIAVDIFMIEFELRWFMMRLMVGALCIGEKSLCSNKACNSPFKTTLTFIMRVSQSFIRLIHIFGFTQKL